MHAGGAGTVELEPEVELASPVADGLRDVPVGMIVVKTPPLSTDTTGTFDDIERADGTVEGSAVADVGDPMPVISTSYGLPKSRRE